MILSLSLIFSCLHSQNKKIDSLYTIINQEKQDTTKVNILARIAAEWGKINLDSALPVGVKMIELAERSGNDKKIAFAYYAHGMTYFLKGDYPAGMRLHLNALKVNEKAKPDNFTGQLLISLGNSFMMMQDYEKSNDYYQRALALFKETNSVNELARVHSNIGLVYAYQSKTEKAVEYFTKSLEYRKLKPNEAEEATTYDFIGFAYIKGKDFKKALLYLEKSLEMNRRVGNPVRIMDNLRNIGECYLNLHQHKLSEKYLLESLAYSKKYGYLHGEEGNNIILSNLYTQMKDYNNALKYYENYVISRDSIYSTEKMNSLLQQEIQFEYDKKAAADSVKVGEEKKIMSAKLEKEKTQRSALYAGIGITALFALFMVNRYRVINRQKKVIDAQKKVAENQKEIIEEKQKEIMDSINYAKRIQLAHMPSHRYFTQNLERLKNKKTS